MLRFALVALCGVLACSCATTASAQTSSQLLAADLRAQFAVLRSAMEKVNPAFAGVHAAPLVDGRYNLYFAACYEFRYHMAESYEDKDLFVAMMAVADTSLHVRADLSKLGYPASVWLPDLEAYEASELAIIQELQASGKLRTYPGGGAADRWEEAANRIAAKLRQYRGAHPVLTDISTERGCGAGPEAEVKFQTEPAGAQVLFITTFFYELCKAQKLDPDDMRLCNRWREAHDGRLTKVIGDYLYVARWSDGAVRKGQLTFTDKDDGKTVTLRKQ